MPATVIDRRSAFTRHPVRNGAGGYCIELDVADDNAMAMHADTAGCFFWDPSYVTGAIASGGWRQIFTTERIAADDQPYCINNDGILASASAFGLCATNSSIGYVYLNGYIWKTTDGFATATRLTSFSKRGGDDHYGGGPNALNGKFQKHSLVVDPSNPDVVYVGIAADAKDGTRTAATPVADRGQVLRSIDGGTTWTAISPTVLPKTTNSNVRTIFAFDRVGGKTAAYVSGSGLYLSTDGGETWALQCDANAPTFIGLEIAFCSDGATIIVIGNDGATWIRRLNDGVWSFPVDATNFEKSGIAVDPNDTDRVIVQMGGGGFLESLNGGALFAAYTWGRIADGSQDVPWLAVTAHGDTTYMSAGDVIFDRATANKLITAVGFGVWDVVDYTPGRISGLVHNGRSRGDIENIVPTTMFASPHGSHVQFLSHDVGGFSRPRAQIEQYADGYILEDVFVSPAYPELGGVEAVAGITHITDIDCCYSQPEHMVAVTIGNYGANQPIEMLSSDGGATWTRSPVPAYLNGWGGGTVAMHANDPFCIVHITNHAGNDGAAIKRTVDGGNTWQTAAIEGLPTNASGFSTTFYYTNRHSVVADPHEETTGYDFYVHYFDLNDRHNSGVFRSADKGATWTRACTRHLINSINDEFYNGQFTAVPGHPGHFLFASVGGPDAVRSTDGCVTWSAIPFLRKVGKFSVGNVVEEASYPRIWFFGEVSAGDGSDADYAAGSGVYYTDDWFTTLVRVTGPYLYYVSGATLCECDKIDNERVYVGQHTAGPSYYDTGAVEPPPIEPPIKPPIEPPPIDTEGPYEVAVNITVRVNSTAPITVDVRAFQ